MAARETRTGQPIFPAKMASLGPPGNAVMPRSHTNFAAIAPTTREASHIQSDLQEDP